MEHIEWSTQFFSGVTEITGQMMAYLPRVLAAVAVLFVGWFIAKLIRMLSDHVISGLDRFWHKAVLRSGLEQLQPRYPPAKIAGEILYWLVILLFIALAAHILGMAVFVDWLTAVVAYLPQLLAGLLIVLAGFIVSSLVRDLVAATAFSSGMSQGDLLGRAAQMVILLTAIILGIDQIGIDVMFLAVVLGIILAATLGAVALAFGFGARVHASNIIAAHQLQQLYKPGERVQIGDITGKIIEITTTRVVLDASEGRVNIPASQFETSVSILLTESDKHEGN
ncbi:MAG: mechanosensitive ion channel [Gammaproteobacteria bacterium]|nr:mechanosensitive ion channel [Gammaproteobacteria bacterium]